MNVNCTTTAPPLLYYAILMKHSGESKYLKSNHCTCRICRAQTEYMINRRYDSLTTRKGTHLQSKQKNDIKNRQSCMNNAIKTSSIMSQSALSPPRNTTTNTKPTSIKWNPLQIGNQQSQSEWKANGVRPSWCNSSHHCSGSCSMSSCQLQSTSNLSAPTPSLLSSSLTLSPSSIGALPLSSSSQPSLPESPLPVVTPQPVASATCSMSLLRPSLATTTNEISSSLLPSISSQRSLSKKSALLSCGTSLSFRKNSSNVNSSTSYSASLSSSGKYCANVLKNERETNVSVLRTFAFVTVMLNKCFTEVFGTRQRIISKHEIENQVNKRRQSKQSSTNSFSLPKFPLILTFLVLSLMTLMLPTSVDAEVRLQRKEHVCKSKDIRNTPDEFYQLSNCTVIEGFLLITLIDANSSEYQKHSFPLLTEVTEFVMIYHVNGLRTLSTLFPNLSVIRGKNLFEGYALVIYENRHLEDVGLPSLITVLRGAVRIEKNPDMCFVNTIDWSEIAVNMTNDQHFFRENKAKKECPLCPGDREKEGDRNELSVTCPVHQGKRHCWNSRICQKICPSACKNNCNDDLQCCDEACIGGCDKLNKSSCSSCRNLANTTVCMDKCPANFFSYQDRRCITAETCTNVIGMKLEGTKPEYLVPFNGTCSVHCPTGYNKVGTTCVKCDGKCQKFCEGVLIDSVGAAKQLHGCTHIYGSALVISIKQGGRHLMEELEMGLSSIEVIDTYLKVHRTYGLVSLSFFKNLKVIKGQKLESDKFVLYVLENQDLESIWGPNQTVKMEEGRVFFHFNPKLCYSVIDSIRPSLKNASQFDENEVAQDSNGSKGSCNTGVLDVKVEAVSAVSAIVVITNPMKFDDDRVFIGYQFFHTIDPYGNVSMFGHKPCDDKWTSDDPSKDDRHVFTNLKPYTQYAFYVKTHTISSEKRNGQSQIIRFRTKPDQPKSVQHLMAYSNSSSEIVVNWQRPLITNGNLTKYIIMAKLDETDPEKLRTRNYCLEPLKEAEVGEAPWATVEKTTSDCVCEKNVTRKDGAMPLEEEEIFVNAIDFENNIQNFVYVKQTNDTPPAMPRLRRRRTADFSSAILDRVTPPSIQTDINTSQNESRMDRFGTYYEQFVETVNVSHMKKEEFVLKKLKHFSSYTIMVKACRAPEEGAKNNECSPVSLTVVRTQKLSDVDIVRNLYVKLEQSNTTRGNLRVKWDPPERPNSLVVSYTIFYVTANSPDAVREKRCITEPDYQQNFTNGYLLTGLSTGNYSIQVRANSLAGEGIKSEPFYIYIPPHRVSAQTITLIVVILSILVVIIGCVVYYIRKKFMAPPTDLKIFPTVNPYYISMQYLPDEWEVPREKIIQLGALGQGSFGMVYEGILKNFNNEEDTPCAIKTVNENATDRERLNFLKEASVMKQFNTHHVVRLLGVCSRGQPAFVIMELMKNGDLKAYLRQHRPDAEQIDPSKPPLRPPTLGRILQIAIEIADGMAYLAAKKFVHRDLAARNCMVASDLTVKIGDFGMTRDIYETDYYRKGTKGLLPVRWMAPESLKDGVFSSASDVFSYGVVLWEMATLASQPYQGYSNDQVLHFVIDGGVMARPDNCPDKLYKLMQKCWEYRPSARPTFMEIIRNLLDSADPKFQEVSFYHSAEAKDILDQMHPEHDLDDVTTPLRVDEFDYKLNIDDNSSVEQHESPALDEEDEDDDDEIVQPHSPYSLGSAIIINSSTPGGHSKNSSNIKINQSNPSLSLPSTSAAAIAVSLATCNTDVIYVQPDPLCHYNNDHNQTEQNENCKFIEDDKISSVNNPPPTKKAIKNKKSLSSNTSKYPNSFKRAVASTVQNVSNSLVPLRITNMNFLHHRIFKSNSNALSFGGKGEKNNANTNSDTANSNNGNNNSSNPMIANVETGSTGSRSFFSALTPSHTSKNPNYEILHESINLAPDEYSLEERQSPMESPQQARATRSSGDRNIYKNDGNNTVKQEHQLNKTTEQCNLSRDSTNLSSNSKFKDTKPSQSTKNNQPTNTSTAHELSSSSGVSSPIRVKDNRHTINTPTVISTSTPLTTKTPYQLKENWLKQLPQMPPPNGFIGREG